MHKIQMYENLRDMLEREVKEIEKKNDLDPQALENIYKLTCSIKNVDKCIEREEREMGGMSSEYIPSRNNWYGESRDNFRNRSYRGQSYENSYGYSRDNSKKKMVQKLETLMDDTMSETERNAIMDCINRIK